MQFWTDTGGCCPRTYVVYLEMRNWLNITNTQHKFAWINTGVYLPDYLWIDSNNDSATYFKLKYGL